MISIYVPSYVVLSYCVVFLGHREPAKTVSVSGLRTLSNTELPVLVLFQHCIMLSKQLKNKHV